MNLKADSPPRQPWDKPNRRGSGPLRAFLARNTHKSANASAPRLDPICKDPNNCTKPKKLVLYKTKKNKNVSTIQN